MAKEIDWKKIDARIEAVGEAIRGEFSASAGDRKKILRDRARVLAREPERAPEGEFFEIVEFTLAGERYGLESSYVQEVYPLKDYTPVPCTPPFVLGLVNVRGRIISVVDLEKFFGMPEVGISDTKTVIIVRHEKMEFGIVADSIVGVRTVSVGEMQPVPSTLSGIRGFFKGITKERAVVLDAIKLLTDKNIVVHESA